jgi:hypothetical protein
MDVAQEPVRVERLEIAAYTIPTEFPEADGTLSWDSTTIVIVHAYAGGKQGLGYTYGHKAVGELIRDKLTDIVVCDESRLRA